MEKVYKIQLPQNLDFKTAEVMGVDNDGLLKIKVSFGHSFKYGDIVRVYAKNSYYKNKYMICIAPNKHMPVQNTIIPDFFDIANIDLEGNFRFKCAYVPDLIEPASPEDIEILYNALEKLDFSWDPKYKTLVSKKWRAKEGNEYFYISKDMIVEKKLDLRTTVDNNRYNANNYFETYELAYIECNKITSILNS